jgi:hypothetical protein
VIVTLLGCRTVHSAATNSVHSKSYQEALESYRATPAYEQGVLDVLLPEAKWVAQRLGIDEPIVGNANDVEPPNYGLGGTVGGTNYFFTFSQGRFKSVRWYDWPRKIQPPLTDMLEFARRPTLLDNDGALALAQSWLTNLGVDLAALAAKSTPSIFHVPANSMRETVPGQPRPMRPQFIITWPSASKIKLPAGRPIPPGMLGEALVTVEILGTTKQVIELTVNDATLWTRPKLQVKDADKLLGPDPTPAELMAKIVSSKTYETIANADSVEAWLIFSFNQDRNKRDRSGPVKLEPDLAKKFSEALLSFESYNSWNAAKGCIMDEGARLVIKHGAEEVHVRFCFECDMLTISGATRQIINFDVGHNYFADLFLEAFPNDAVVRSIPRKRRL